MQANPALFAPLLIASLALFAFSCYRRFSLVALGQPEYRLQSAGRRFGEMLLYAFGQKRVVTKPYSVNHFVLFWAFMLLALANAEFLLKGVFPALSFSLLPDALKHLLLFVFDVVSLLALVCAGIAVCRRLFFAPPYLDSRYVKGKSFEALLILSFIALLMLAYFGLHGAELAMGIDQEAGGWMPVSSAVAGALQSSPFASSLEPFAQVCWWLHAVVLLAFLNFLPVSKHMHILTAIPNCFLKNLEKTNTVPREEFAEANVYGAGEVSRFTWKDLFDSYACTECGRCQEACPACSTGKSLNPRQVVHSIKANLLANSDALRKGADPAVPLIGDEAEHTNTEQSIWGCTTCGACQQVCPVLIEHMPKIVKMRRHLVQNEATFPEELLNLFENTEGRSNPWGIAPTERTKWTGASEVKTFEAGKTEYLFFVGCAGSFDARHKHVTVALATVLDAAGVSWGILGKDEQCCGDSLRRLGNEFVFDRMARENVKLFKERGIKKVITHCPHCFTTLKNDYRQYGLELEVIHHSELVNELLASGKLKLNRQVKDLKNVVFHDSCYLGRHNDVYDAPRKAIEAATGSAPAEMGRSRENSFCCGAGGGRMWMEEFEGSRINHARVEEAINAKADTVCVSCPYCMTMFEDGLKDKGAGQVKVRDIAEVVAEGLRPL